MPYTVKSGDTMSKIAKRNGITVSKLLDANPKFKPNPDRLRIGDVLNIPGETVTLPPPPADPTITATPKSTNPPTPPPQPQPGAARELGALSSKFETSGRGAGTVSGGEGDPGGVSYGSYQMTSKPNGGTVRRFVLGAAFEFADRFDGLKPGSPQFSAAWKALAASDPEDFQAAQHDYIKRTHFDVLVQKLIDDDGVNVLTRSHALQDVIWSTAVQHGGATDVPSRALENVDVGPEDPTFDEAFITAIYEERGRKRADGALARFPRVSPAVRKSVANRFKAELADALAMLADEQVT